MHVEAMTEKGEVSFAEECKRLLDLRDEIGNKGDKKHALSVLWTHVLHVHLNLSDSKLKNAATTTAHLYTLLSNVFEKKK